MKMINILFLKNLLNKTLGIILRKYTFFKFRLMKFVGGIEYANKIFITIDKNFIIPLLRKSGAHIGENTSIDSPLFLHNVKENNINLNIGDNVFVSKNCLFDLRNKITVDDNCTLGMGVQIITHMEMGYCNLNKIYPDSNEPVKINNNVYLGAGVIVLKGIEIQNNVIIGAGSLVNKNTDPYSVYVGIPIKKIKKINKIDLLDLKSNYE